VKLRVLSIGRNRRGPIETLIADYGERLARYLDFESVLVGSAEGEDAVARRAEAEALRRHIRRHDWVVALDETGELLGSAELAGRIQKVERSGGRDLTFLIGGPSGLDPELRASADWSLALSRMTFPHAIARLVLVEQLYRSMTLLRGEPYHK
jgi:23S rRNA (pseudouridine1915-N3)-methyltransferase